jgi:hypothetical protein
MPQPKIYKDHAQRQAAYRKRKGRQGATQAELATLARSLHAVMQTAVRYCDFPLPHELAAQKPELTMKNLIQFLDPIYDPVRNPKGRRHRSPQQEEKEEPKTDQTQL